MPSMVIKGTTFKYAPEDELVQKLGNKRVRVVGYATDSNSGWQYVVANGIDSYENIPRDDCDRYWDLAQMSITEAVETLTDQQVRAIVRALGHAVKQGTILRTNGKPIVWESLEPLKATGALTW